MMNSDVESEERANVFVDGEPDTPSEYHCSKKIEVRRRGVQPHLGSDEEFMNANAEEEAKLLLPTVGQEGFESGVEQIHSPVAPNGKSSSLVGRGSTSRIQGRSLSASASASGLLASSNEVITPRRRSSMHRIERLMRPAGKGSAAPVKTPNYGTLISFAEEEERDRRRREQRGRGGGMANPRTTVPVEDDPVLRRLTKPKASPPAGSVSGGDETRRSAISVSGTMPNSVGTANSDTFRAARPLARTRSPIAAARNTDAPRAAQPRPQSHPQRAVEVFNAARPLQRTQQEAKVEPQRFSTRSPRAARTRTPVGHTNATLERLAQPRNQPPQARTRSLQQGELRASKDVLAQYGSRHQSNYGGTTVITPLPSTSNNSGTRKQSHTGRSDSTPTACTGLLAPPTWSNIAPPPSQALIKDTSAAPQPQHEHSVNCSHQHSQYQPYQPRPRTVSVGRSSEAATGKPSIHSHQDPVSTSKSGAVGEVQVVSSQRPKRDASCPPEQVRTIRFVPKDDDEGEDGGVRADWSPLQKIEAEIALEEAAKRSAEADVAAAPAEPTVVYAKKRVNMRELIERELELERQRALQEEAAARRRGEEEKQKVAEAEAAAQLARAHRQASPHQRISPLRRESLEDVYSAPTPVVPRLKIPVHRNSPKTVYKKRPLKKH